MKKGIRVLAFLAPNLLAVGVCYVVLFALERVEQIEKENGGACGADCCYPIRHTYYY